MEKEKSFWEQLFGDSKIVIDTRPLPETKIINNYYVYNEHKVIQLGEQDFREFIKEKKVEFIEHKTKLIR